MAEGGTLLRCYVDYSASRVRIPLSPNFENLIFRVGMRTLDAGENPPTNPKSLIL